MHRALAAALAVSLGFAADPPGGSKAPAPQRQRTIRIPVLVEDEPVAADRLKASLLTGGALRITRVRSAADDLLLLVVMDLVGDLARIDPARSALIDAAKALPSKTWMGLMKAQDGLQVLLDPTPDRDKFAAALSTLPLTGKAGFLETVEQAVRLGDSVAARSPVRVAVLYITDSDVRNYREDFSNPVINSSDSRDLSRRFPEGLIKERTSRLAEKLTASQTPVFLVHLAYSSERLNEAYQTGLMQIATTTGGAAEFCRTLNDVATTVTRMVETVQRHQQVHVQLPAKATASVNVILEAEGRSLVYRSRFQTR
jgi:hypothetical protein